MGLILALVVGSLIEWVILLIVIPIAQRLADFSTPAPVETAWKLLVIVLLKNVIGFGIGDVAGWFFGRVAGIVVFWGGLKKVFDIDLFGAGIIIVVSFLVQTFLITILMAAFFA